MLSNFLYVFKEATHGKDKYAGRGKIFLHHVCTGNTKSYSVDRINWFFENNHNRDSLLERMIIMMEYLQQGYHNNEYPGPPGQYEYAHEEFPMKYLLLVKGLSDQALQQIRNIDVSIFTSNEPADLGEKFYRQIIADRARLIPQLAIQEAKIA